VYIVAALFASSACESVALAPEDFACQEPPCDAGPVDSATPDSGHVQPVGAVVARPSSIDFGAIAVGDVTERQLVLENGGDAAAVISMVAVDGDGFSFDVAPRPIEIPPAQQLQITVRHRAADERSDRGALRITVDGSDIVVDLTAVFEGNAAVAVVADPRDSGRVVTELDFGQVPLGVRAKREVFVKNAGTGNSVLVVEAVAVDGGFSVQTSSDTPVLVNRFRPEAICTGGGACPIGSTCDGELCVQGNGAPWDTLAIWVYFEPSTAGLATAQLSIRTNATAAPLTIELRAVGLQSRLQIEPDPIELGTVFVGFPTRAEVSITNVGRADLTIEDVRLLGANAGLSLTATASFPRTSRSRTCASWEPTLGSRSPPPPHSPAPCLPASGPT